MAETQTKRPREESHDAESTEFDDSNSNSKRPKLYNDNNILSLLDEEEVVAEPSQDFSAIFATLQQELSSSSSTFDLNSLTFGAEEEPHDLQTTADPSISADEDEGVNSVMRHLLEASDDELGIPSAAETSPAEDFPSALADNGLWELEDVAANYYTMLQSELFI